MTVLLTVASRSARHTPNGRVLESKPEAAPSSLAPGGSSSASRTAYSDALQPRGAARGVRGTEERHHHTRHLWG